MIQPSDPPASGQPHAGRELVILPVRERPRSSRHLRNMGIASFCLIAAAALGWGAGAHVGGKPTPDPVVAAAEKAESARLAQEAAAAQRKEAQRLDAQRQEIRQLAEDVRALKDGFTGLQASLGKSRQSDDAKSLKAGLDAVKQGLDSTKSDMAGAISQLSGKLDRVDQGNAQKLAKIAERLDQLERRPDPMPVGSVAPQPPARPASAQPLSPATASQPPVRSANAQPLPTLPAAPPARPVEAAAPPKLPIPGFVLHEVYQGVALVEGRGGYREVRVGEPLPGAGKVEAIERRGRRWVVVTTQGLIPQID